MDRRERGAAGELTVREAPLDELPRIAHLKKQIHDLHVAGRPDLFIPISDMDAFTAHAAAQNCALIIAECGGEAAGYVLIRYVDRPANPYMNARSFVHVEEFCVDEDHQRMGIGKRLMEALKQLAREKGYLRIELDVWSFNEGAKRFYEASGMTAYRTFMEMSTEA